MEACLRVTNLTGGYVKKRVLENISLEVHDGEFVGIIGHNGAGKTTLLKTIMGLLPVWSGDVYLRGRKITNQPVDVNVQSGLAMVPQERAVFRGLSVADNLRTARNVGGASAAVDPVDVLDLFPILKERMNQEAGTLSGGEQRMLAISMALLLRPSLLLLDEPSLGLSPLLVGRVMDTVRRIRDEFGTTVVLVEQNLDQVFRVTDRVYVVRQGGLVWQGLPSEITSTTDLWKYF